MPLIYPYLLSVATAVALALSDAAMAQLPQVDFDRMGKVGLAGSFAGLEVFNSSSVAFDPSTSTILSRGSDGSLTRLASTNSGGVVSASCTLGDTVYFGGSFSNIDGVSASNVASYTPSSDTFSALGSSEPNGEVHALYCDEKNKKVWAGGRFTSPSRAVAVWDANAKSWSAPPFAGLTGAAGEVLSITTNSSAQSLFFAGSFITSFAGNTTSLNNTNNPNVPFSTGATPFSSSLVPVPLGGAQIVAQPTSNDPQFSDIHNILCPTGNDGPGQTWFAADGNVAVITARAFSFISSGGIRLGNTFLDGRGTTGFSVTTIPDNAVRTLRYFDPSTGQNRTCSNDCPLLSDASIPYQDFLFDGPLNITGVQVTLSKWTGAGPGLHLFQLLSSGAFAVAVGSQNGQSCYAPSASNTTFTGNWVQKDAFTTLPGTTQSVLVSSVDVGKAPAPDPSFTWRPYISAAGRYTLSLLVPGCANFADCPLRTSVKVTVFPGGGQQPWVTTVDQRNTADAATIVYDGPIVPTPEFFATVSMSIADQPVGTGQNGKYAIVADRVQLVLNQANVNGTTSNGNGPNGTGGVRTGFGFFEWPISGGANVNATAVLANTTETALDALSLALFSGLRGGNATFTGSSSPAVTAVVHHSSGAIFLGGNFTLSSGAANIVAFKNGALTPLADNGVDGSVSALALSGDSLFVGGSFGKSASGGTTSRGVMLYDVGQNKWTALADGVDGAVTGLAFDDRARLQVTGNFSRAIASRVASIPAGGLATWDAQNGTWVSSGGFLVGSMNFVSNITSAKGLSKSQFVAGSVTAALKYGTSGFVMLGNGDEDKNGGAPDITALGVQLNALSNSSATRTTNRRKRATHAIRSWLPTFGVSHVFARQSNTGNGQQQASNVSIGAGPIVNTGAFWTNSSSKDEITILGGNFSFAGGAARNVAIYDSKTGVVNALRGSQPSGVINALYIDGDTLYLGGQFTLEGASVNGLAIYDLARQTWANDGLQSLRASEGKDVVVRSITTSGGKENTIIVAGAFLGAGSLTCNAICAMDTSNKDFSALGTGIQGDVVNVAYAGEKQDILVASGMISLSDNSQANVVQYSFSGGMWTAVGSGLPGPVTALEVNNGNGSSIFAAGRASDGNSAFISFWNGAQWSSLSTSLQSSSNVTSMTMVPVRDDHDANGIVEKDRMLLVSGSLVIGATSGSSKRADSDINNASSALFDGVKFIPYLVSASPSGGSGSISSLVHSFKTYSFTRRHFLATGIVILISIAIAAGIVFLLVLIGIIWSLLARRDDKHVQYTEDDDDSSSVNHHRPTSLLTHINAATRNTILGTSSPFNNYSAEKDTAGTAAFAGVSSHGHGQGTDETYGRPDTPSDAVGVALGGDGEEQGRSARARYSFDGKEEGELPLTSGLDVIILDDHDPSWWYAMDPRTGREGVIPSNYVA